MSEHILVVEDSPTQAQQLAHSLQAHGYEIVIAVNGEEGLEAARRHRPALIISDIVMPVVGGYEMCHVLKQDKALSDIPVILLSALSDPGDIIRGLQSGTDYYLTKPYDENYMLSKVESILSASASQKSEEVEVGLEVVYAGERHVITSHRQQMMNLLLCTYENAVQQNRHLVETQRELENLNVQLEEKVRQTTALQEELAEANQGLVQTNEALENEVAERKRAEEELRRISISRSLVGQMLRDLQNVGGLSEGTMHRAGERLGSQVGGETLSEFIEAFADMGLGTLALVEADEERHRWIFTGDELVEFRAQGKEPMGHYTKGFLCSAMSHILGGARVAGVELACQSMGDELCRFVIQSVGP